MILSKKELIESIDHILDELCFELHKIIDLFVAIDFNVKAGSTIYNNQIFFDNYIDNFINLEEFKVFDFEVRELSILKEHEIDKKLDKILSDYGFYNSISKILQDEPDVVRFLRDRANDYRGNFESYCISKKSELGSRVVNLIFKKFF